MTTTIKKSTKKQYQVSRKALVGLFKEDKIGRVKVRFKCHSDGYRNSYWYNPRRFVNIYDGTFVGGELINDDGYNDRNVNLTCEEALEVVEILSDKKIYKDVKATAYINVNYRKDKFTTVDYRSNSTSYTDIKKAIAEIKKSGVDTSKVKVKFSTLSFKRKLTEKELFGVNKCIADDLLEEERRKKRIEKEEAAAKKRQAEYEKRIAKEKEEEKKRIAEKKKRDKLMEEQGDLAFALQILSEKGLDVIVVKDGKALV